MSLDVYLSRMQETRVFEANITHNLNRMAGEAGVYEILWRPEEVGVKTAAELIEPLRKAIYDMETNPDKYRAFEASNGWGTYDQFVPWLREYLQACEQYPDAAVSVSR